MKTLEIKNVYKNYNLTNKEKFTALHDINLEFDKGELVSIIGESGSGKSTLMNLIGGLDSSYTGEIKINGNNIKNFKKEELDDYRKKKIGFVFQSFNLIPHLTVIENVTIGLTLSNEKENVKLKKAIEILAKLGLENHLDKKPTQLSGGQKQRVAIARALINNPDIILADEPTGSLDSVTSEQILRILKEIADDGKLVIMVTHSEKVAKISSRIIEITDGKIVRDEKKLDYCPSNNDFVFIKEEENNSKQGHLSLISAFKLSIHNMWSSKIKNLLMTLGVSISIIALILMLSFGSGLTSYVSSQAEIFINPNVVSITKKGSSSIMSTEMFTNQEISQIVLDLNEYLRTNNSKFKVITKEEDEYDNNLTLGFNMITGLGSAENALAKITYQPEQTEIEEQLPEKKECAVFYSYTTPPFYNSKHLITSNSEICGDGEIMLSSAASKELGIENLEDVVGKTVTLTINFPQFSSPIPTEVKISGIVDASIFSNMLVMYIDYDFLSKRVSATSEETLSPTTIYITTNNSKTTDLINSFISSREELSGSIEEKLVNVFSDLTDTVSSTLTTIACISVIVALIMILVVLYISVSERTKEIGVLKSIGARNKDIKFIFCTESLLIGVLAGLMGIIFSLLSGGILTLLFKSILGFAPLKMRWYYFFEAFALSLVISIIAGLYPAAKAAKLDPIESLRHE